MRRIIGVVIAALVLSGCGAKEPTGGANDTLKILTDNVDRAVAEKQTAKVEYNVDAGGQSLRGSGEIRFGANAAMNVSRIDQAGAEQSILVVDGAMYLKDGLASDESVPWYKIDMTRDDPAGKAAAAAINQLKAMSDPSQFLKQMVGAGTLERTDRDGEATHHTVAIDPAKLASVPGFEDIAARLRAAKADRLTMEIWAGQDNLLNQIRTQVDCPAGANCTSSQDMYFSEWGTPVTVTAPPANQVREYPRQ